jgi:hypothetical protein
MFTLNYGVALSRRYSEYDLLPLTPDQEIHGFEYRGADSDHFAVQLYGTNVSALKICAETYNFKTKEESFIESKEIRVVRSSAVRPLWDSPIEIQQRRLLDELQPLSYKVLTHLNYQEFLLKLNPNQIESVKGDFQKFLSIQQDKLEESPRHEIENLTKLKQQYVSDKPSMDENKLKQLAGLMQWEREQGFATENALIRRIERMLKAISECKA